MDVYRPPLRDIKFVLEHIVGIDEVITYPGYEHVDEETISGALDEAGRFMAEVVAPTNRPGDTTGSRFAAGSVTTPDEYKKAWSQYVDAGWSAVTGPLDYGGHGFPETVGFAVSEMFVTANLAFSLNPMLTGSAITLLRDHASDELRDLFLEKLVTAEWTGTMVLTEPQAGSDLGAVRTSAAPNDDGSYRLNGSKIFITWGDHDLADNIIHLVLARLPDAPPGTKGVSLFVVPKFLLDDDGRVGERNSIETVSIEHKLGIHGSPTCVLSFEDATGYLVGEPHRGMRYMFSMMNQARREVGLEGLGIAERSYQLALSYAKERHQGRAVGTAKTETSPIIEHPDVRRMLMTMKAYIEAGRALLYDTAAAAERSSRHPDEAARGDAEGRVALLTPVAKAWCTDVGVAMTSVGLQVHGGMGFVEETGAAQHYRDSRITPIYEGTNGIQAIDLVLRKLPMGGGTVIGSYLDEIAALDSELAGATDERLHAVRDRLSESLGHLRQATSWLLDRDDANDVLGGATPYLDLLGTVAGGYYLARLGLAAAANTADSWLDAKVSTAAFYAANILPRSAGLLAAATSGATTLFAIDSVDLDAG
ncbi:MAG: acyl-CoA dehydrogenase [Acidimicrobiia bacterium]|nr:MAG: acyl-CoA dehydrogenase [Acidimicrobiia bacterium]